MEQSDCNIRNATRRNPSGCLSDLYPFVIVNYTNQIDSVFDNPPAIDDNGGGNSMAFYNVQHGDVPVLKALADEFTMSDNFHQSVMGGTGANHVMLGTGDAIFWSDSNGNPTTPPSHIANPDPLPGTDDVYTVDLLFDGNFTECADVTQPGIKPIRDYLESLPYDPAPRCEPKHFYMVNNDSPGFLPDGTVDTKGIASGGSIPPIKTKTIGEALNEKNISWAYYGGAYTAAVNLQHNPKSNDPSVQVGAAYCNICNFESYATAIMGDPAQRTAHIKDTIDFFNAIDDESLPSVSFVKPDGLLDGLFFLPRGTADDPLFFHFLLTCHPSDCALQGASDQLFGGVCTGTRRLEQARGLDRPVTQGDQRSEGLRFGIRCRRAGRGGDRRIGSGSKSVPHLDHEALGGLSSYARDTGQRGDILVLHAQRKGLDTDP